MGVTVNSDRNNFSESGEVFSKFGLVQFRINFANENIGIRVQFSRVSIKSQLKLTNL